MKYTFIIFLFSTFLAFSEDTQEWKTLGVYANAKESYKLLVLGNNNVDLDIKLSLDNSEISIQNGPEKKGFNEYIILNPQKKLNSYKLEYRATKTTLYQPHVEVISEKLISGNELVYYQMLNYISQIWFSKPENYKSSARNTCNELLTNESYYIHFAETLSFCGQLFVVLEDNDLLLEFIEKYDEPESENKFISYKIQEYKALVYASLNQFELAMIEFKELLMQLDKDKYLNDTWLLKKELVRGNLGLYKSIFSFHENLTIEGFDEINTAIENSLIKGDYQTIAKLFQSLATYYTFVDRKEEALAALDVAIDYQNKSNSDEYLSNIHNQIGVIYFQLNQLSKAQYHYRKTLELIDNEFDSNKIKINLARTYLISGDNKKALRYYTNSLNYFLKTKSKYLIAYLYNKLGIIERLNHSFSAAIELHLKSISAYKSISNVRLIESINELGFDYYSKGEYKRAQKIASSALIISGFQQIEHKESKSIHPSIKNLINVQNFKITNDKFQFLMKFSLEELNIINKEISFIDRKNTTTQELISQFLLIKSCFQEASNVIELKNEIADLAQFKVFNQLPLNYQLGIYELQLDFENKNHNLENIHIIANNALEKINGVRSKFDVSGLALYWSNQAKIIMDKYVNILVEHEQYSKIFNLLEKYYAINLREKRHNSTLENVKQKSIKLQKALQHYLKLERESQLLKDEELQKNADEAKEHLLALKKDGENQLPTIKLNYLSLKNVQKQLSKNELFLRYYVNSENSFVYIVDKYSYEIKTLPNKRDLEKLVSRYLEGIKSKRFIEITKQNSVFKKIMPYEKIYSHAYNKLIIVPDGVLNLMPFSSLNISQNTNEYQALTTEANVERIYSASDYFSIIDIPPKQTTISIFANPDFLKNNKNPKIQSYLSSDNKLWEFSPLPYTQLESEYIQNIFGNKIVNIFSGKKATNKNFLSELNRKSTIIHIATHGFFNNEDLENVGIATSVINENNELSEGILTMREILFNLFESNLAVISGCETTLGKQINGEGFNSLSRGLLSQGVGAVIGTIWSISDRATPLFMKEFYTNLKALNGNVSKALNLSKKNFATLSKFRRYRHPYYWAGFVLTSSNKKLSEKIF